MSEAKERLTDIGPPHYDQFLPQIIKDNYGKWKNHEDQSTTGDAVFADGVASFDASTGQ